MTNDNINSKTCTKCGNTYPATTEYFVRQSARKDGFHSWCKVCVHRYYQANRDKKVKYQQEHSDKINKYQYEYRRKYYQENKDEILKKHLEYYQANPEKFREYRQENKDKKREYMREYQRTNSDMMRINYQRREARKRLLPDTLTEQQWINCLEYFAYSCAVCGASFEDISSHADHWIPLSSDECTGTIATNMICLCSACNLTKNAKIPDI